MAKKKDPAQRTFEWFKERHGKITGSQRIGPFMNGHIHELNKLLEKLWDEATWTDAQIMEEFEKQQSQQNEYMRWGTAHEKPAQDAYALENDADIIRNPGFLCHPEWPVFGVSRDFIDTTNNWLGEIKCPGKPENHQKTIQYGMGPWHVPQTQLQLECDRERQFLIFVSFDPRHPDETKRLYQQLIRRDEEWVEKFRKKAGIFHDHYVNHRRYETTDGDKQTDGIPSMF